MLASEWRATQAIENALQADNLDIGIFQTYPLMGCYLLVSATLSDLIPVDCFGTPGWMDYIENLQHNAFARIYGAAADLIDKSPWEIEGLPKRPDSRSSALLSLGKRTFATVSPLAGLKGLSSLVGSVAH